MCSVSKNVQCLASATTKKLRDLSPSNGFQFVSLSFPKVEKPRFLFKGAREALKNPTPQSLRIASITGLGNEEQITET